jgi:hypothetical protein
LKCLFIILPQKRTKLRIFWLQMDSILPTQQSKRWKRKTAQQGANKCHIHWDRVRDTWTGRRICAVGHWQS